MAQAIEWIDGLRYASEKKGLDNMLALMESMGNPHKQLKCLHIAGTNGKGSTCAMLERMLRENGYKTGLYTSPYLMRYNERMRVNGIPIGDEAFMEIAAVVRDKAETLAEKGTYCTWFELGTAIAFEWFRRENVDFAVIEVGLGGRLDATNVILPEVCLLAPIGLEHTKILGDTVELIAGEKAGIIKQDVPCVIALQTKQSITDVFTNKADELNSAYTKIEDNPPQDIRPDKYGSTFTYKGEEYRINLAGRHQVDNACLAIQGILTFAEKGYAIDMEKAKAGLAKTTWMARLEWIDEHTLIDGAHNPHGAKALIEYAGENLKGVKIVGLIGMMGDKDTTDCTKLFSQILSCAVATQIDYKRALPCEELSKQLTEAGLPSEAVRDERKALERARELAGEDGVVLICGSLWLAGDMRLMLKDDMGVL